MAFVLAGTATDYLDMLDEFLKFVAEQTAASATVAAGGTGYTVGDTLTLVGGTFTTAATFNVDAESGGVVTAVSVVLAGAYTEVPSDPVATTGGTGTGATLNLTFVKTNGWEVLRDRSADVPALSATVAAGGTGYTVGDTLTLIGGTFVTAAAFNVDTESGGVVTAVSVTGGGGSYQVTPTDPVSTSGGTGTGATLNVTFSTDREVILKGVGSGADEIFVGIRAFSVSGAFNWELAGMTGFQAASLYGSQPGISPIGFEFGFNSAYVPMNNATITYWLFVNGREMRGVFKMGSTYTNMYLGFLNQFGTTVEYPYPLMVMGCTSKHDEIFSTSTNDFSGMVDPVTKAGPLNGPGFIRTPDGVFRNCRNKAGTAGTVLEEITVYPAGRMPIPATGIFNFIGFIPLNAPPSFFMDQTPDSTQVENFSTLLWPTMVMESTPVNQLLGEMNNVFWLAGNTEVSGQMVSEDTIVDGGTTFHVFQNCNRTDAFAMFAIKEE